MHCDNNWITGGGAWQINCNFGKWTRVLQEQRWQDGRKCLITHMLKLCKVKVIFHYSTKLLFSVSTEISKGIYFYPSLPVKLWLNKPRVILITINNEHITLFLFRQTIQSQFQFQNLKVPISQDIRAYTRRPTLFLPSPRNAELSKRAILLHRNTKQNPMGGRGKNNSKPDPLRVDTRREKVKYCRRIVTC